MSFRTDRNNNPAAFTTDIAKQAGLVYGVDYVDGESFPDSSLLKTAKLLHDPVGTTIRVIDAIGFYTKAGNQRWEYIALRPFVWNNLCYKDKIVVVAFMYNNEGGDQLRQTFSEKLYDLYGGVNVPHLPGYPVVAGMDVA